MIEDIMCSYTIMDMINIMIGNLILMRYTIIMLGSNIKFHMFQLIFILVGNQNIIFLF